MLTKADVMTILARDILIATGIDKKLYYNPRHNLYTIQLRDLLHYHYHAIEEAIERYNDL